MLLDPNNCEHFKIMAAMRGPDLPKSAESDLAKWIFTARFRFLVGIKDWWGASTTRATPTFLVSEEQRKHLSTWLSENYHYAMHISDALWALKDLELIEENEFRILRSLSGA